MGYTRAHSEATRARILEAAGLLFRRKGFESASIDQIMAQAGLTRGAFYQHFKSKGDLFAAAVGQELEFTRQLRKSEERCPENPQQGAKMALDYYLTPGNQKKIAAGCSIVSNAADMARANAKTRKAFGAVFENLIDEFEALVEPDADRSRERALSAVATCVGGIVLARAVNDLDLIRELLAGCREAARSNLAGK